MSVYATGSTPIDNHHPQFSNWKCFPNAGQELTESDIGKMFVRCYPRYIGFDQCDIMDIYDWSYVPKNIQDVESNRLHLTEIKQSQLIFTRLPPRLMERSSLPNDKNWILAERFIELLVGKEGIVS